MIFGYGFDRFGYGSQVIGFFLLRMMYVSEGFDRIFVMLALRLC